MQKFIVPFVAGFATAFVVNFLMGLGGVEKGDTTGLIAGIGAGVVVAVVLFNLSGNRRTASADAGARKRALAFAAEPGKAALYLVRTGFVGKMAGMNLAVDGREVAQLKSPRFTRVDISPGPHTLRASFGGGLAGQTKPSERAFECAAGDIVVMKLGMSMGVLQNPVQIEPVNLEAMRGELGRMHMTAPDVGAM
jgi:hypothetical protein